MTTPATAVPVQFDSHAQRERAVTVGMWVFLASELMFFGPMFFGYVYWRFTYAEGFAAASRHTDILLGTLNTAVLLTSSATMALAVSWRRACLNKRAARLLWLTALLGVAFLAIKGMEYAHEFREHLFPGADFRFHGPEVAAGRIFYWLYFAMTGLHALHLFIGIVLVSTFAFALHRGKDQFADTATIDIVGLYWHFVDLVWIFLYPDLYLVGRSGG
ncbi:cytochrome c oxidase subunit 3 [Paucimonas lemoignei]|uniref:Cytochrome c oxidase subunit 3 n=1 Tax=Paucimonas lemoignei TaxID=29443 RepID=A0A4R3I3H2_PAULE|nr:cytochrome c oxidase subunit 3 [Paucimonas lemoignei]TCS39371.1 cytochrome c oxidase subunit 3 [Paucimonas lemoignei]